jgi:hypothetical protein
MNKFLMTKVYLSIAAALTEVKYLDRIQTIPVHNGSMIYLSYYRVKAVEEIKIN